MQPPRMGLLSLPNELILLIADQLPMTGVSGLRRTCRRIYKVLKKLNRRRIVIDDVISIADLETTVLNSTKRNRLKSASALEMSAITVLPPTPSRSRLSLSSFLSTVTPSILYFSLYLVPECDISYIPAPSPATPPHSSLTHLSIINFRVLPSFLALFPLLVEVTATLLIPPFQSELVQLQYRPKDVQALLLALPTTSMKRLTVTCTNLPAELLALAAQRFPNLTHLSFVWVDTPDRVSGGVDTTDITHTLRQYAEAIAPLANTLEALYLPACVGTPTTKYPSTSLSSDDELLGEGPVLFPAIDPIDGGAIGYMGVEQPLKHGRVSVGMKALLDACRTLVKGVGGVKTSSGEIVGKKGMWELMKVGWLIPQGEGMPLLPIECVRRRGVVKFGATPQSPTSLPLSIVNGVQSISISSGPKEVTYGGNDYSPFKVAINTPSAFSTPTSSFTSTTYAPNLYAPRSVPIAYQSGPTLISPISPHSPQYYSNGGFQMAPGPALMTPIEAPGPVYREEDEYWYPNMEWCDDCAWPAFSEIETVFPRPACLRY